MKQILRGLPKLEGLGSNTTDELVTLWCRIFGRNPPPGVRRETILRFAAFRIQELKHGGPAKSSQALIRSVSKEIENPRASGAGELLYPGVRIVRDWRGERHEVKILESGFEYQGQQHRSLTAIATLITGTKRSGPLFFGLRETGK